MAAVYGPGDVRQTKEIIDRATVEVIYKPTSGMPGEYHFQTLLYLLCCAYNFLKVSHMQCT